MGEVANESPTVLLADADVLIDYRESDLDVLKDVGRNIGRLAVLYEVLDEVHGLTRRKCESLGIEVIEVELSTLEVAAEVKPPVSFNDGLCFAVCQERGWTCVTNDRALRHLCRRHDVKTRRGLGLLVDLVRLGAINRCRATTIAHRMHKANPGHINERVLARFAEALNAAAGALLVMGVSGAPRTDTVPAQIDLALRWP